jgi:WD40 repeat protein
MSQRDLWFSAFHEWLQKQPVSNWQTIDPGQALQLMSDTVRSPLPVLSDAQRERLRRDLLVDLFACCLRLNLPVSVDSWKSRIPAGADSGEWLWQILEVELELYASRRHRVLADSGLEMDDPWLDSYLGEFPQFRARIERYYEWSPATRPAPEESLLKSLRGGSQSIQHEESAVTAESARDRAQRDAEQHRLFALSDQVRLESFLDMGSSKWVFRGEQLSTGRSVAVKQFRHDEAALERHFRGEVRIQALIDHQNIPPVFLLNEAGQPGQSVFVEKLITGEKWSETLARPTESRESKLRTLLTISRVLQYAHQEHGVIHRDLKPENVLVNPQYREVYLTDWGSAALLAPRVQADGSTADLPVLNRKVRESVGTAAYMSPEQARGDTAAMGCHTDVFQLGAMLYEIVGGEPPYAGAVSMRRVHAARCQFPPLPADVPAELAGIILRAMSEQPAARHPDAGVFADALERFLDHQFAAEQLQGAQSRLERLKNENPQGTADRLSLLANLQGLADAFHTNGEAWARSRAATALPPGGTGGATAAADTRPGAVDNGDTATDGWNQARLGEYSTRLLLQQQLVRSGDFDQAELQVRQLRQIESAGPPIGEARAEPLGRELQRARQRRRLTGWIAGGAAGASLLLALLTGWLRFESLAAKGREAEATARAATAEAQKLETEARERDERILRETAERELALTAEFRDFAEAQRRTGFSQLARSQQLETSAAAGALDALPLLRGDRRDSTIGQILSATHRGLSIQEQSPRRISTSKVAVAQGGQLLLSADHESAAVRVWDAETGELLAAMEGHQFLPSSAERGGTFSSITGMATVREMGDSLLTAGVDGTVIRWNLQSFEAEKNVRLASDLNPHWTSLGLRTGQVPSLPNDPVVGSSTGDLVWFDAETLEERHRVTQAHAAAVRAITQSADGTYATSAIDGSIRLWTSQGEPVADLRTPDKSMIRCLAFSPRGTRLLVGGEFDRIELWDVATREMLQAWKGHDLFEDQQVTIAAIPLGEEQFLTGGGDGKVIRWNAADGQRLSEASYQTAVENKPNRVRDVAWDPTRNQWILSLLDGTLVRADSETGEVLFRTTGPANRFPSLRLETDAKAAVNHGGAAVLTSAESVDGALQLWQSSDLSRCRFVANLQELWDSKENQWAAPTATALSPSADRFALGHHGKVFVRSAEGILQWSRRVGGDQPPQPRPSAIEVQRIHFDPTGEWLATLATNGVVQIWRVADGTPVVAFETRTIGPVAENVLQTSTAEGDLHLLFLSSSLVVTAGENGARLWNGQTGELIRELGSRDNRITTLARGPTDETVLAGDTRGTILQWEVASGREVASAVLSPASASFFRESQALRRNASDPRFPRTILSLAVTHDGNTWIAAMGDGTLSIIDRDSGVIRARAVIKEEQLSGTGTLGIWDCTVFLDQEQRLCTVSSDRVIRRWRFGLDRAGAAIVTLSPERSVLQLVSSARHGWGAIQQGRLVAIPGSLLQAEWQQSLPAEKDLFWELAELSDGRLVASRRRGATLVWDPATGETRECPAERKGSWNALVAAAGTRPLVATTIEPQKIALWDLETNTIQATLSLPKFDEVKWRGLKLRGPDERNLAVLRFSPGGDLLAAVTETGEVLVWQLGDTPPQIVGHGWSMPMVQDLQFTRDGRRLLQTGARGVLVWNPREMSNLVTEFNWHDRGLLVSRSSQMVHTCDCSPDGQWLVTTGVDGTIRIGHINTETDEYVLQGSIGLNDLVAVPGGTAPDASLASQLRNLGQTEFEARFSHDGQQIAIVSDAQRLAVVETEPLVRETRTFDLKQTQALQRWIGLALRPDFTLQIRDRNAWRTTPQSP